MITCNGCGKKLRFFEGYRHPTLGGKNLLCSPCFDKVQQSVEEWREFILSNSFHSKSSIKKLNFDWMYYVRRRKKFDRVIPLMKKKMNSTRSQNDLHTEINLDHLNYKNNNSMSLLTEKA